MRAETSQVEYNVVPSRFDGWGYILPLKVLKMLPGGNPKELGCQGTVPSATQIQNAQLCQGDFHKARHSTFYEKFAKPSTIEIINLLTYSG